MSSISEGAARYAKLVALPHTIFALPFAVGAAAIAWRSGAAPFSLARLGLIVVAVAAARTAAMAFNRVADRRIDAANPRTAARRQATAAAPSANGRAKMVCGSATRRAYDVNDRSCVAVMRSSESARRRLHGR